MTWDMHVVQGLAVMVLLASSMRSQLYTHMDVHVGWHTSKPLLSARERPRCVSSSPSTSPKANLSPDLPTRRSLRLLQAVAQNRHCLPVRSAAVAVRQ